MSKSVIGKGAVVSVTATLDQYDDFASLPAVASTDDLAYVRNTTGIFLINRHKRGVYRYNGAAWEFGGDSVQTASNTSYDNTTSSLVATTTQGAIDEIDGRVDTVEAFDYSDVSANDAATDVTGAELETLTDGSNADALHTHAGAGEANTGSNVNVGGVGVFDGKVGVDLQFKGINAGSSKLSVTDDAANNEIDLDVVEANIVHQNLSGAGTNTHAQIDTHIADTANPHTTTIANLDDTTITSAARGDILAFDGSGWVEAQAAPFMIQFSRNSATTANQWLRGSPDAHQTADAPILFPFDVKLIAITTTTRDSETWDAELYNGTVSRVGGTPLVGSALAVVNNVAVSSSNNAFDVDIASGTEIAVYLRGTGVSRPHVQLWFVRRI